MFVLFCCGCCCECASVVVVVVVVVVFELLLTDFASSAFAVLGFLLLRFSIATVSVTA